MASNAGFGGFGGLRGFGGYGGYHRAQCARSLILREKWGVASLINSMYF